MRNIILIPIFIFLQSIACPAQHWKKIGNGLQNPNSVRVLFADSNDNYLYVAGQISYIDGKKIKGIARWNGNTWDSLQAGIDGLDTLNQYPSGPTQAICRFNNELIVGGTFHSVGSIRATGIAKWNGTSWDTLSVQPFASFSYAAIMSTAIINNELYIGGSFDTIVNIPCSSLAKWDGISWQCINLPQSVGVNGAYIFSICEYNGDLYVAGNFTSGAMSQDTLADIMRYDGLNWHSVGGGMKGSLSYVSSLKVYNGNLYVGGLFTKSDGNAGDNIQIWDGSTWSDIGGVHGLGYPSVSDLLILKGKLYVLGNFENAGGVTASNIATWDGYIWCCFGDYFNGTIAEGCIYKDSLIVGGGFSKINTDTMNFIVEWTGGNYIDSCSSPSSTSDYINILKPYLLYPNPCTNYLFIDTEEKIDKMVLIDVLNHQENIHFFAIENNKYQCDLSNIKSGLYLLQILDKNRKTSFKIYKL